MSEKYISLDNLKEYNKQMKETYIEPLDDRTKDCPRTEISWKEVFNNTFTTVIDSNGNYSYQYTFSEALSEIPTMVNVTFDGKVYDNLVVSTIPELGDGIYGFGNLSLGNDLFGSSYENTGEPFVVAFTTDFFLAATDLTQSTTHSMIFSVPDGENIIKLDEKYLPDSTVNTAIQLVTEVESINAVNERQQKELDGKVTIATFEITTENTTITLQNLIGMTEIDWGKGVINSELSHTYSEIGEYICKIYDVTGIDNGAFFRCKALTSVKIGDSVTSIGNGTFNGCSSLTNAEIPDSVRSIGILAFSNCSNLTSVIIPKSVTTHMSHAAFEGCTSLTIYCEAESQPSGWDSSWNPLNRPVVWGYKHKDYPQVVTELDKKSELPSITDHRTEPSPFVDINLGTLTEKTKRFFDQSLLIGLTHYAEGAVVNNGKWINFPSNAGNLALKEEVTEAISNIEPVFGYYDRAGSFKHPIQSSGLYIIFSSELALKLCKSDGTEVVSGANQIIIMTVPYSDGTTGRFVAMGMSVGKATITNPVPVEGIQVEIDDGSYVTTGDDSIGYAVSQMVKGNKTYTE